jgi:hypothetical protein
VYRNAYLLIGKRGRNVKNKFTLQAEKKITILMSLYANQSDMDRLVASVGYPPGKLDKLVQAGGCTVVFAEIDRAHPKIIEALFDKNPQTGFYNLKREVMVAGRSVSLTSLVGIDEKDKSKNKKDLGPSRG